MLLGDADLTRPSPATVTSRGEIPLQRAVPSGGLSQRSPQVSENFVGVFMEKN